MIAARLEARRAGGDSGVGDTVVNQLLSKMDGVNSLNNILVIGMTNRKDLIDPALLRPGRLEVHIEISLPDEKGRVQILNIHTKTMKENGRLGQGRGHLPTWHVSHQELQRRGAGRTGQVRHLLRAVPRRGPRGEGHAAACSKEKEKDDPCGHGGVRCMRMDEIKPSFGVDEDELSAVHWRCSTTTETHFTSRAWSTGKWA